MVQGLGFEVQGSGCMVQGVGRRVRSSILGFQFLDSGLRIGRGLSFRVHFPGFRYLPVQHATPRVPAGRPILVGRLLSR